MSSAPVNDVNLTVERLPYIGRSYEMSARDHHRVTVVIDARGNRHISIGSPDHADDQSNDVVAVLDQDEASVLSLVLAGAYR